MLENLKLAWQNSSNSLDKEITNISIIKDIIKSSNKLKNKAIVIKLPSIIIINDELLASFIESIKLLDMCGAKIYIVHDHIDLHSLYLISGIDKNFSKKISKIDINYSINNTVIMEILSTYVNKLICYAIGISGKDANLLQARKSTLSNRRVANHDVIDIGFISEPIIVNPEILLNFEDHNIILVITPFAHDSKENTHLLNVNLTAAIIASTLGAHHLILPYKKSKTFNGFPYNLKVQSSNLLKSMLNDNNQLIEEELIKIGINMLERGNNYVHSVNSEVPNSILLTTFTNNTNFY